MFHLRRIGKLPVTLLLLLLISICASGQVQKSPVETQTPATTRADNALPPIILERGSGSKETAHVVVPSDPLVIILRPIGFEADHNPIIIKPENNYIAGRDHLLFPFCGITTEDFAALKPFRLLITTRQRDGVRQPIQLSSCHPNQRRSFGISGVREK